ncbi:MAG TPA: hypothetical protein V6D47_15600 [Oscillatoriaceae cyanobacterium]
MRNWIPRVATGALLAAMAGCSASGQVAVNPPSNGGGGGSATTAPSSTPAPAASCVSGTATGSTSNGQTGTANGTVCSH